MSELMKPQYFHLDKEYAEVDIEGEIGAHFVIIDEDTYQKWTKAEQGFTEVKELTFTHSREKVNPTDRHIIDFNGKLKSAKGVVPESVVEQPKPVEEPKA